MRINRLIKSILISCLFFLCAVPVSAQSSELTEEEHIIRNFENLGINAEKAAELTERYMQRFSDLAAFVASGYALNAYVSYVGYGPTSMGIKSVRRIYNITVTDGSYGVTTVSGLGTTFYVSGSQVMYISG